MAKCLFPTNPKLTTAVEKSAPLSPTGACPKSGPSQAPGRYKAFRPSSARASSNALSCIDSADDRRLGDAKCQNYSNFRTPSSGTLTQPTQMQPRKTLALSADNETRSAPLRNDHIVLWAIDGLLALHVVLVRWRSRRRTFRALADLDEEQLQDVGLTRSHRSYRALAELDDTQLCHLSEHGLQVRREVRRKVWLRPF